MLVTNEMKGGLLHEEKNAKNTQVLTSCTISACDTLIALDDLGDIP